MINRKNLLAATEGIPFRRMIARLIEEGNTFGHVGGIQSILDQETLYQSPLSYLSWKTQLAICCLNVTRDALDYVANYRDVQDYIVARNCMAAIRERAPARYISKELCEAFINTSVPELAAEIANIFPVLHIFLPRGYLLDWEGDEVVSLIVQSVIMRPKGEEIEWALEERDRAIADQMNGGKAMMLPPDAVNVPKIDIVAVTTTGLAATVFLPEEFASLNGVGSLNESPGKKSFCKAIERIAVNSLMAHLYEPELVTVESFAPVLPGRGFSKNSGPSPLPVTWIGKTFRYQRDKSQEPGTPRNGVRSHWRRGHWHTILHGQKRQQRRTQWFKPIYVGSK